MANEQEELKAKAAKWIATKAKKLACVGCGGKELLPMGLVGAPTVSPTGVGPPKLPMVQVGCAQCGHIVFFHAGMMGLF